MRIVALATVLSLALAAAACAPTPVATPVAQSALAPTAAATSSASASAVASASPTVSAPPPPSGRFIYGYGQGPASGDPHNIEFTTGLHQLRGTYDGLLELAQDGKTIQPALALSWTILNPTTWEFKLRPNVRFHNGDAFDASVAKFNLDRAANLENRLLINASLSTLIQETRVVSPDTIQLVTKQPDPTTPRLLFPLMMIPPAAVDTIRDRPIGTGPLRVERFDVARGEIVLRPFTQSWRGPVRPAEVEVKRISEIPIQRAAIQTGEIDITTLPAVQLASFRNTNDFRIQPLLNGSSISLEMFPADTEGPLKELKARQAVQAALNVQEIIGALFEGEGIANACQIYDDRVFGYNAALQPPAHDPARARQLLTEAGFPNGFNAKLLYIPTSSIIGTDVAQAVAGQLGRAGIRIELNGVEAGIYSQIRANGGQPDMVLQVGNFSATMDASTPLRLYRFSGRAPSKRFNSERFNQLFDASVSEFDVTRRGQLLAQAAQVLCQEQGTAFMMQNRTQYVSRARIDGFQPTVDLNPWFWTVGVRP